jgi:ABC-2 type transport system ATP-binding protein
LKERVGGDVITLSTRHPQAVRNVLREKFAIDAPPSGGSTGGGGGAESADGMVRFERVRGHEFVPALFEALPPGLVDSVSVGKPTLEDVFINSTGHRFRDRDD